MENKYLSRLSRRQKVWFLASLVIVLLIGVLGILSEPDNTNQVGGQFTVEMSIQEIAPILEVTGKGLARELDLQLDTPKKNPDYETSVR